MEEKGRVTTLNFAAQKKSYGEQLLLMYRYCAVVEENYNTPEIWSYPECKGK